MSHYRSSHYRSGSYVRDYWRSDGTYVRTHYRSGGDVSGTFVEDFIFGIVVGLKDSLKMFIKLNIFIWYFFNFKYKWFVPVLFYIFVVLMFVWFPYEAIFTSIGLGISFNIVKNSIESGRKWSGMLKLIIAVCIILRMMFESPIWVRTLISLIIWSIACYVVGTNVDYFFTSEFVKPKFIKSNTCDSGQKKLNQ